DFCRCPASFATAFAALPIWQRNRIVRRVAIWAILGGLFQLCLTASEAGAAGPFVFRDAGDAVGLFPHVAGIRGHGAAWGDVDGDGWPDLFVTAFHNAGSKPSVFLRNERGKFHLDDAE